MADYEAEKKRLTMIVAVQTNILGVLFIGGFLAFGKPYVLPLMIALLVGLASLIGWFFFQLKNLRNRHGKP